MPANNPYGVRVSPLVTPPGAPLNTLTKTYHGLAISGLRSGAPIGRIQAWSPQMYTRDGTHIYEIGAKSSHRPVDYVPGNGRNYSIVATRTEVWQSEFETEFGYQEFTDLVSQRDPFTITEVLFGPSVTESASALPVIYRIWHYHNCWFSDKNTNGYEAEGDARVIINATIHFVSRTRAF